MSRFGLRLLGAPVLALALFAACSLAPAGGPPVVDGYSLGDIAMCEDGCQRFIDAGREWLDSEAPDHRPVVSVEVRWLGAPILLTRSGGNGDFVVVLHLDDDSMRAIMVLCGVGLDHDRCFTMPAGELHDPWQT
jgi:hypothetical protein